MSSLYKFSALKEKLLKNEKDLSNDQKEQLHKLTRVFEDGFQRFNDEILLMGDHLVEIFGSVEKFSRMKRDISVVTLKPVDMSTERIPSKIENYFGKSWESIKNGTNKVTHYFKRR